MIRGTWLTLEGYPEIRVGQYVVPNFVSNSVALRCSRERWLIASPGQSLLDAWKRDYSGAISVDLLCPNAYHHLGVTAWQEAFPQARVFASRKAIPHLRKQGIDRVVAVEEQAPPLPPAYQVQIPPGHRGGDLWLCRGGDDGVWITCDSFLNYQRLSNQPLARTLQRVLGAAPGLRMSQVVKWFILDDRKAFQSWVLELLTSQPPHLLIPSHGECEHDDALPQRLRALVSQRLG